MTIQTIGLLVFAVVAAVSSQLIFKSWVVMLGRLPVSSAGVLSILTRMLQSPLMLAGLLLYAAGFLAWIFLLGRTSLSSVYPIILSANIVLVLVGASWLFHESLSGVQIFGVVMIGFGIFLIFLS